ncbi:MAG: DMT family transporter [Selenomonadaceae bacterium]|nr:DMT family transporter [Selenomonadaceae bacterium]
MQARGALMLLGASFFWGTTFVAQMTGMDRLGPFSYAAARYFLGFLSLLAVLIWTRKSRAKERQAEKLSRGFLVGLVCGIFLFAASSMQQISMLYTTAGKAAFITCLYIMFVPLAAVIFGRKILRENWIGAGLALVGLYLLAINEKLTINIGDVILFFSAFVWTAQILAIDKFAAKVDVLELSTAQIFITMVLSFVAMEIFETPTLSAIQNAIVPIAYGGIFSAGVAFTLQIYGQKYAEPAAAAILMSFESIFGAVSSWLILGEAMSGREIFGCALMIAGIFATQWRVITGRR